MAIPWKRKISKGSCGEILTRRCRRRSARENRYIPSASSATVACCCCLPPPHEQKNTHLITSGADRSRLPPSFCSSSIIGACWTKVRCVVWGFLLNFRLVRKSLVGSVMSLILRLICDRSDRLRYHNFRSTRNPLVLNVVRRAGPEQLLIKVNNP